MEIKQVTIPVRDAEGYFVGTRDVLVEWVCSVCGEPMGEVKDTHHSEDGNYYNVSQWTNDCGHVSLYTELRVVEEL